MFLRPQVFFWHRGGAPRRVRCLEMESKRKEGKGESFKSMFFELLLFHGEKKKSIRSCVK